MHYAWIKIIRIEKKHFLFHLQDKNLYFQKYQLKYFFFFKILPPSQNQTALPLLPKYQHYEFYKTKSRLTNTLLPDADEGRDAPTLGLCLRLL